MTATQSTSLPPAPMAPPAPVPTQDENGDKAVHESAEDGAWDKRVDCEDLVGGIEANHSGDEAKHGSQAGHGDGDKGVDGKDLARGGEFEHGDKDDRKGAKKDSAWDKGVDGEDLVGGTEDKHGGKASRKGAKGGTRDKGVDSKDYIRRHRGQARRWLP